MRFRWSESKNQRNIAKHGISFEQASQVFDDPFQIVVENYLLENHERQMIIGMSHDPVLITVVFVDCDEIIRIVNARKAVKYEEKLYEENLPKG